MARNKPSQAASAIGDAAALTTMSDQAHQLIRDQILHGKLEPGEILSERMLAERLQLGKAPVRAAVQRLASEGFLSVEPRRGIVVSPQSIQDVIDLFEIRVALEQLVARRVAGTLHSDQISQLHAQLRDHQRLAEDAEPAQTLTADFEFHRMLCRFHGNVHLVDMLNRILDSLFPELRLSHEKAVGRVSEGVREHQAVAEAVIEGDGERARDLMTHHLHFCQQFVMSRGASGHTQAGV